MIKIVSNNFSKISQDQIKAIAEECKSLIDSLNKSGKKLSPDKSFKGGTPTSYNNPWLCFVEEAENGGKLSNFCS